MPWIFARIQLGAMGSLLLCGLNQLLSHLPDLEGSRWWLLWRRGGRWRQRRSSVNLHQKPAVIVAKDEALPSTTDGPFLEMAVQWVDGRRTFCHGSYFLFGTGILSSAALYAVSSVFFPPAVF